MNHTSRRSHSRQPRRTTSHAFGTRRGHRRNISLSGLRHFEGSSDGEDSPPSSPVWRRRNFNDGDSGYGSDLDDNSATRWARESYPALPRPRVFPPGTRRRHYARRDHPQTNQARSAQHMRNRINTDLLIRHQAPFSTTIHDIPEESNNTNEEENNNPHSQSPAQMSNINNNDIVSYYISFDPIIPLNKIPKAEKLVDSKKKRPKKKISGCRLAASHDFQRREE
ncbi:uncharacterized protein LOC131880164 [Tigriopus californicus]|uniref:uncharacterized protein LOC131880164 n=1 Tax=Tigriopus californicus TaxID=6832 RepID=UPI0027DA3FCB|nr:uncharacterized protein LOC131880164 [Tigriopus californicus]